MIKDPPDEVLAAVEDGTARITRRCEITELDGETIWIPGGPNAEDGLIRMGADATVTIDSSRDERRNFEALFDNRDGAMSPNAFGGFWYDKMLKPYRGIYYKKLITEEDGSKVWTDVLWEVQMGEYMIDSIDGQNFPNYVKVVARDQVTRLQNSKFEKAATFSASTKLGDFIRSLATTAGVKKMKIPANLPKLGLDYSVEIGADRWSAIKENCDAKSVYTYFDNEGYLVVEDMPDPFTDPTQIIFKTGPQGNLSGWGKGVASTEVYNKIIVIGERPDEEDATPYYGIATNNDPASPTSTVNIGVRMMDPVSLTTISSNAEAAKLAATLLKVRGLESYTFNGTSINYPWMEVGVSSVIDEPSMLLHDPRRYMIESASLPLGPGPMTWVAKRLTIVGGTIETPDPIIVDPDTDPDDPDPETDTPGTEPDPEPTTTVGPTMEITIATYNLGPISSGKNPAKTSSLNMLARAGVDVICIQEGSDRGPAMTKFLQQNKDWTGYFGKSVWTRHIAVLWRKNLGTVTRKQNYYHLEKRYLGNKGTKNPYNEPKYMTEIDIKLTNGRTIQIFNNHMISGADRSRKRLGTPEYNRRRAAYTKQVTNMANLLDARKGLAFICGDYNAVSSFSLLNPITSRIVIDNTGNTSPGRRIDFVGHRSHAAVSVTNERRYNVSSDHECAAVTYLIKGA